MLPVPIREIADTWASIYSNSAALRSAISFAHVGGLVGGGGCALAADRATLRAFRRAPDVVAGEVHHLHGTHNVVLAGLAVVIVSGVLLMFADLDAYLVATAFWIKMGFVVALFVNGSILVRTALRVETGDAAARTGLKRASIASIILWFATTLIGAALPNVL
jgi:hypothetical protein